MKVTATIEFKIIFKTVGVIKNGNKFAKKGGHGMIKRVNCHEAGGIINEKTRTRCLISSKIQSGKTPINPINHANEKLRTWIVTGNSLELLKA